MLVRTPIEERERKKQYYQKYVSANYERLLEARRLRRAAKGGRAAFQADEMDGEIWKPVVNYEGFYEISNFGRLKRIGRSTGATNGYIVKGTTKYKYHQVALSKNNKPEYHIFVHRLVAQAFIPNPENKPEVNHIDGNKLNNRVENLEWVTRSENAKHAGKNGLLKHGENHHMAKLTEDQVVEIYKSSHKKADRFRLAHEYGISHHTVRNIQLKYTWKHFWGREG